MKILGWLLLGTTTLCFVYCFCQQQLLVQADNLARGGSAAPFRWDEMPDGPEDSTARVAPTTQPSRETNAAHTAVASNDLVDAAR